MYKERRTMKRGEKYEIEEKVGYKEWEVVCQCHSIEEAKEILKNLKTLDGEEDNSEKKD